VEWLQRQAGARGFDSRLASRAPEPRPGFDPRTAPHQKATRAGVEVDALAPQRVRLAIPALEKEAIVPRSSLGLALIAVGFALALVGLLVWTGALSWFGRLPGDIRVERPNTRLYIPITSMLLVSVVLSVLAAVIRRFR
jgi:hypothetical protein